MKRHLPRLLGYVLLLTLLSGCASVVEQSPAGPIVLSDELLALMETVNLEHQAVIKPEIDEAAIVERWARDTSKYTLDYQIAGSMSDGILTAAQAKNDVNVLFYNLQTKYGLYEYFGGDKVFGPARETILQACDEAGALTPGELLDILMANLTFARDGHFSINGQQVAPRAFSFHYRDVAFEKTESGYQTLESKKRVVASVDGYDNLDTLFRRSISDQGTIVYYPVVLVELAARDFWTNDDFAHDFIPGDLVVRFKDGSSQLLPAEVSPVDVGRERDRPAVELYENQSVPVLFSRRMGNVLGGDWDARDFLTYAETLKDEPVAILDLRSNGGGQSDLPYRLLQSYTGKNVTGNGYGVFYDATPINNNYTTPDDVKANVKAGTRLAEGLFCGGLIRMSLSPTITCLSFSWAIVLLRPRKSW